MNRFYLQSILLILIIGCSAPNNNKGNGINDNTKESNEEMVFSRDKFEELFLGKPREFAEKRLGKANKEQELFAINSTWLWYKHKTYSTSPDVIDQWVKIKFNDFASGTAVKINYE